MSKDESHARDQAGSQLENIKKMVKNLENAIAMNDETWEETARELIREDALSVEVRNGWYSPGCENEPEEYTILLCTGGPAVRIYGDLEKASPKNATLQYQDWFKPWTNFNVTNEDEATLLTYANHFYFGE